MKPEESEEGCFAGYNVLLAEDVDINREIVVGHVSRRGGVTRGSCSRNRGRTGSLPRGGMRQVGGLLRLAGGDLTP